MAALYFIPFELISGVPQFQFRTFAAMEGPVGLVVLLGARTYGGRTARLKDSIRQHLILWQGVGTFVLSAMASTLGANARAKIVGLVLAPNTFLGGHVLSALGQSVARRAAACRGCRSAPGWRRLG